jgi:hypothetical protein
MQAKAEAKRQAMRRQMPEVARFVDQVRREFGEDAKVVYAAEGGVEVGKRPNYEILERAAIQQFDGGLSREEAEKRVCQEYGLDSLPPPADE